MKSDPSQTGEYERMRASLDRFLDIFPGAFVILNGEGSLVFVSPGFVRFFGYTAEHLQSIDDWWPLAYPDPTYRADRQQAWRADLAQALQGDGLLHGFEGKVRCLSGEDRWIETHAAIGDEFIHIVMVDISDRKKKETQIEELNKALSRRARELEKEADLDSLTELPVRRAFLRECERELILANRYQRPFSVGIIDIDHFKRINDQYGHPVGDLALQAFARVLQTNMRKSDYVGRWGGEEFVVLLPNTSATEARNVLNKLRAAIRQQKLPPPASDFTLTVSAGVTEYQGDDQTIDQIIQLADRALYEAKAAGRDRVGFYQKGLIDIVAAE